MVAFKHIKQNLIEAKLGIKLTMTSFIIDYLENNKFFPGGRFFTFSTNMKASFSFL